MNTILMRKYSVMLSLLLLFGAVGCYACVDPLPSVQLDDTVVCAEVPLTIDGYTYTPHNTGIFSRHYTTDAGCDSVVWQYVTVLDSILPVIRICPPDSNTATASVVLSGSGYDYYIVDGGYPQTSDTIAGITGNSVELEFFNSHGCSVVREVVISDCMAGWVYQRWDDVLSLKNHDALNTDSAMHTFADFQWYKNNQAIAGATLSYLYEPGGLDMYADYYLSMTRVRTGERIMTCPLRPTAVEGKVVVQVYPSPVRSGGVLHIKVSEPARVIIVNSFGATVLTGDLRAGINDVVLSVPAGVYVVYVYIADRVETRRVGVVD